MTFFIDECTNLLRENKTVDIVKRIGVITADRVYLTNHPAENPVTLFNPTLSLKNDNLNIFKNCIGVFYLHKCSY